ncbi:MAG: adenylate/guanylate cyclase domain-containing protein [Myxococcaceae bacterium]|nr:adenylate/guanylate cyclase domain-containing protein [Myxococcaceae bacterium]
MRNALRVISLRFARNWLVMLGVSVLATALSFVWWQFDVLEISDDERAAYDDGVKKFTGKAWFPWGAVKRSDDIVIIAIDDKTFRDVEALEGLRQRYGSWPYDRVIYADVFEYVKQAGAKMILFDAILDNTKSDGVGDLALGQTLKDEGIPLYLGFNVSPTATPFPKVDAPVNHPPLRKAEKTLEPVPLPAKDAAPEEFPSEEFPSDEFPSDEPADAGAKREAAEKALAQRLADNARVYAFPVELKGGVELERLPEQPETDDKGVKTGRMLPAHPVPTIDAVRDAVSGYGLVIEEKDEDGKMRRTRFAYTDGTNTYVTFPVAAMADALGADAITIEPGKLTIGPRSWAIDRDGAAWIDYHGTLDERFRSISLVDVLKLKERQQGQELFKDKYVFVAGFALGTGDGAQATPLEASTPGVVKHAATFDNLLHDGFITDAPLWASVLFTFFMCLFSCALVLVVRNVFVDVGWPALIYVGFFLITGSFLVLTKVHVLSAMPSLAGTIASVLSVAWERLFAGRERERIKELFRAYMEEDLVDLMVEGKVLPRLDGEARRVTAFFSDIKGFSTVSEAFREDPKGLMRFLNRYLSAVTPALRRHGACIDKYIGDAVVALFGAPIMTPTHPLQACKGALEVQQVLAALRTEFAAEGLPDVYTRIGINTDTLLVGNIGSDDLLDYTAIGDGMNLAARLEAANKNYDTLILIGQNTYEAVKGQVVAREVDTVKVAGKSISTRIYELVGLVGEVDADTLAVHDTYAQALALYRNRRFSEAQKAFDQVLSLRPSDGPAKTLKSRCFQFSLNPPPPDWDGSVALEK